MSEQIKITAKSIEEFKEIEAKLSNLDESIRSQIRTIEKSLVGYTCILHHKHGACDIFLPKSVSKIVDNGNYIGIFEDDHDFFFTIDFHKAATISYIFI